MALGVSSMIIGNDEHGRMLRRTIIRYLNLSAVLVYRAISSPVKKRFPTMEHLVEAGFITEVELKMFDDIPSPHSKWYVPCIWSSNLLAKAYRERRIVDEYCYRTLFETLAKFRNTCGALYGFDWVAIPLVYTQVVTLANYTFFFASLMGRQLLDVEKRYPNHDDVYFPIFTFLQFFFYMGWFKVAEELMNPFGEDEDDFDVNWIIDRNLQISFLIVDGLYNVTPTLEKDIHWDDDQPDLPYTAAAKEFKKAPWMGSTANIFLDPEDMAVAKDLEPIPENAPFLNDQFGLNRFIKPYPKRSDVQGSVPGRFPVLQRLHKTSEDFRARRFAPSVMVGKMRRPSSEIKSDRLAKDLHDLLDKDDPGNHSDSEIRPTAGYTFNDLPKRAKKSAIRTGFHSPEMASSPGLIRKDRTDVPHRSGDAWIKASPTRDLKKKISNIFNPMINTLSTPTTPKLASGTRALPAAGFGLSKIIHGDHDDKFKKRKSADKRFDPNFVPLDSDLSEDLSDLDYPVENKKGSISASASFLTSKINPRKYKKSLSLTIPQQSPSQAEHGVDHDLLPLVRKNDNDVNNAETSQDKDDEKTPLILSLPIKTHTTFTNEHLEEATGPNPPLQKNLGSSVQSRQALNKGSVLQLRYEHQPISISPGTATFTPPLQPSTKKSTNDLTASEIVEHPILPISQDTIQSPEHDTDIKELPTNEDRIYNIDISLGGKEFSLPPLKDD
ncbi:unnamed protein product [Gordionus sp. m RMFG-2023]